MLTGSQNMRTIQDKMQRVLYHQAGRDHVQRLDCKESIMTKSLVEVSRI